MTIIKRYFSAVLFLFFLLMISLNVYAYNTGDDYPANLKEADLDAVVDPWLFYNRECTSFVAWCLNSRNGVAFSNYYGGVQWGHAKDWAAAARSLGISVDGNPAVGSVAWKTGGDYGHVAWVSAVNGDSVTIEEYNNFAEARVWGAFSSHSVAKNSFQYIHIKDLETSFTFENYDKYYEVKQNSAHFGTRIYGSVYFASEVGCALYDPNRALIARSQDGAYREGNALIHHFIIGSGSPDINVSLSPSTKYYYQFYVIVNGTYYPSEFYEFTTLPPDNPQFTFENYEKYQEIGNDYAQFGTKIYGSVNTAANVGCELYNQNKGIIGSCEDGAYLG